MHMLRRGSCGPRAGPARSKNLGVAPPPRSSSSVAPPFHGALLQDLVSCVGCDADSRLTLLRLTATLVEHRLLDPSDPRDRASVFACLSSTDVDAETARLVLDELCYRRKFEKPASGSTGVM